MATKIKRCLYVGLGGTGMNSLLHTKKMFIDTYGEVPPMIGFLGIDTDGGAYKKSLQSNRGIPVSLDPNEQLPILVNTPRPIYDVNKEDFSWIPQENLYALTSMNLGAGQVRSNGRFAFTVNYEEISRKVSAALAQITNAHIVNNGKYDLLGSATEIHMVFSVCGGTGCGTFINMAYVLRQEAPDCKLTGYAVLPDVFKHMSTAGMAKVAANAFGAINDLDYLMHMGIGSKPIKLEYINASYEIKDRPFNSVIFIDNKNDNLDTYTHVDELAEMISLALVTSAGELSSASASVSDNIEKNIREGAMDIENKKAWAAGMGVCEILFRGQDLGDIYSIKAAKNLIDRFFNSCEDANLIANNWIDSPNVNIRENNNYDHVIDYICDKIPKYELTVNDYANPKPEVEANLNMNRIKDEAVNEKINALCLRVRTELRTLLAKRINQACGISTCENVLASIEDQVNIFLGEMKNEKEEFLMKEPCLQSALDTACADLSDYDGKFFKSKTKLEDLAGDVSEATKDLASCRLEIIRRTAAITVFNNILGIINEAKHKIGLISESFKAVNRKLSVSLAMIQNQVGKMTATFQIDLAQSSVNSISINVDEIQIPEFVKGLHLEGKVYGFNELSNDEIEEVIMKYAKGLHTAKVWRGTGIDNVIDNMPQDEFDRMVDIAIKKAMPLFRYDYRGYMPKQRPQDSYFVGVPDKKCSRLFKDSYFKNRLTGTIDVDFASIGVNDRIIIYRQVGVVPAYAISPVFDYAKEYEKCNVNCHYDANLQNRMEREDFSLRPKKASDEDMLDFWVKGLIFGLVKNNGKEYFFKSQEHGDPLDDSWVSLGEYRDEAFDSFRTYKNSIRKEFKEYIDSIAVSQGAASVKSIIEDVKLNYYDKYSQINMDKAQVKSKGYEKIRQLITDELSHVKHL
ncbi:MAG: tubulin-like doman-containing protein [Bacteroidales bacterium]|nr:tubulin-like doman-containing protein [Bacteroidales bacterium]